MYVHSSTSLSLRKAPEVSDVNAFCGFGGSPAVTRYGEKVPSYAWTEQQLRRSLDPRLCCLPSELLQAPLRTCILSVSTSPLCPRLLSFSPVGCLARCQLHLLNVATCPLMSQIPFTQKAFATPQSLKQNPNSTKPQTSMLSLSSAYLCPVPSAYHHKHTSGAHLQGPGLHWSGLGRH